MVITCTAASPARPRAGPARTAGGVDSVWSAPAAAWTGAHTGRRPRQVSAGPWSPAPVPPRLTSWPGPPAAIEARPRRAGPRPRAREARRSCRAPAGRRDDGDWVPGMQPGHHAAVLQYRQPQAPPPGSPASAGRGAVHSGPRRCHPPRAVARRCGSSWPRLLDPSPGQRPLHRAWVHRHPNRSRSARPDRRRRPGPPHVSRGRTDDLPVSCCARADPAGPAPAPQAARPLPQRPGRTTGAKNPNAGRGVVTGAPSTAPAHHLVLHLHQVPRIEELRGTEPARRPHPPARVQACDRPAAPLLRILSRLAISPPDHVM